MASTVQPGDLRAKSQRSFWLQWAVIGILLLMTVESILSAFTYPYFSLALEGYGLSTWAIGLNASVAGAGILFVGPFLPRAIARYGIMPLAAGMYALPLLCFAALLVFKDVVVWYVARFLMGACFAALWATTEIWLNAVVDERQRGRMMSVAMVLYTSTQFIGPMMLSATGIDGAMPIIAAMFPLAFGVILTFFISTGKPYKLDYPESDSEGFGFRTAFQLARTLTLISFLVGVVTTAIQSLFPLYAISIGLSDSQAAELIAVFGLGEAVLVAAFGLIADMFNRWRFLKWSGFPLALLAAGFLFFAENHFALIGLLFVSGGILGILYTLCLILIGQDFTGHRMAVVSTGLAMAFSLGIIAAGPLGYLADVFGPIAIPFSLSAGLFLLALTCAKGRDTAPAQDDEPEGSLAEEPVPLVPQTAGMVMPYEPALAGFHQREAIHVEEPEVGHLEVGDDRKRKERDLEKRFRERAAEIARRRAQRNKSGVYDLEGFEADEPGDGQSYLGSHLAF